MLGRRKVKRNGHKRRNKKVKWRKKQTLWYKEKENSHEGVQFHQHSTYSFYTCRSQKCKNSVKSSLSLYAFRFYKQKKLLVERWWNWHKVFTVFSNFLTPSKRWLFAQKIVRLVWKFPWEKTSTFRQNFQSKFELAKIYKFQGQIC